MPYRIDFTGEYSGLKDLGFVFQRLYAMNYMQWGHEESELRVWKKGAEVTASTYPNGMIAQLLVLMENGVTELPTVLGSPVVAWHKTEEYVTTKLPDWDEYESFMTVAIKPETLTMLRTLKDKGWIQSSFF